MDLMVSVSVLMVSRCEIMNRQIKVRMYKRGDPRLTIIIPEHNGDPSQARTTWDKKGRRSNGRSMEFSTEIRQDSDAAKPKHGGHTRLNAESGSVSDGFVEALIVEEDLLLLNLNSSRRRMRN